MPVRAETKNWNEMTPVMCSGEKKGRKDKKMLFASNQYRYLPFK